MKRSTKYLTAAFLLVVGATLASWDADVKNNKSLETLLQIQPK